MQYLEDSHSTNGECWKSCTAGVYFKPACVWKTFWKEDLLNLTNFEAVYLTQFLTDFSQILDSKSYDQA